MLKKWGWLLFALIVTVMGVSVYFSHQNNDSQHLFNYWSAPSPLQRKIDTNALNIVAQYRDTINYYASKYNLTPTSIAGIIVAEKSLHTGPVNFFEEYYVETKYLNQPIKYLENLADSTEMEMENKRKNGESVRDFNYKINHGLIWTIGICQMSIIKARKLEEIMTIEEKRPKRNIKAVIQALLIPEESVKYCAFELKEIRDSFLSVTEIDISNKPEILATLYNTGNITQKAKKYIDKKVPKTPEPNDFGRYVLLHEKIINQALKINQNFR